MLDLLKMFCEVLCMCYIYGLLAVFLDQTVAFFYSNAKFKTMYNCMLVEYGVLLCGPGHMQCDYMFF